MTLLRKQWFVTLLLFPFLVPYTIFDFFPSLSSLYNLVRVIWCSIILITYFLKHSITVYISILTLFSFSTLLSLYINFTSFEDALPYIYSIVSITAISMIFEMCLSESFELLLKSYIKMYTVFVVINFVFVLLYPEGVVSVYAPWANYYEGCHFLCLRNHMIVYLLPYIVSLFLYSHFKNDKLTSFFYIMLTISALTIFLTWSATGIITLLIVLVYLLIIRYTPIRKFVNFRIIIISSAIMYFLVVIIRIQVYFQDFIEGFLNRNVTLTGRTQLWDFIMRYISLKPIFGWGGEADIISVNHYGAIHTHNKVLDILIHGGIISLALWLIMIIICGYQLQKYKNHEFSKIITIAVFALLTAYLTEVYSPITMYILYVYGSQIPEIIRQYELKSSHRKIGIKHASQFKNNLSSKIPKTLR